MPRTQYPGSVVPLAMFSLLVFHSISAMNLKKGFLQIHRLEAFLVYQSDIEYFRPSAVEYTRRVTRRPASSWGTGPRRWPWGSRLGLSAAPSSRGGVAMSTMSSSRPTLWSCRWRLGLIVLRKPLDSSATALGRWFIIRVFVDLGKCDTHWLGSEAGNRASRGIWICSGISRRRPKAIDRL